MTDHDLKRQIESIAKIKSTIDGMTPEWIERWWGTLSDEDRLRHVQWLYGMLGALLEGFEQLASIIERFMEGFENFQDSIADAWGMIDLDAVKVRTENLSPIGKTAREKDAQCKTK